MSREQATAVNSWNVVCFVVSLDNLIFLVYGGISGYSEPHSVAAGTKLHIPRHFAYVWFYRSAESSKHHLLSPNDPSSPRSLAWLGIYAGWIILDQFCEEDPFRIWKIMFTSYPSVYRETILLPKRV